jgi:phage-related protein
MGLLQGRVGLGAGQGVHRRAERRGAGEDFFDLERLVRFNIKLGPPYVEQIEGRDFWELRTKLGGDIYRTFYFAHTGKKFVLLHAYHKKSQKAPKRELDTAEERMKDYLERTKRR